MSHPFFSEIASKDYKSMFHIKPYSVNSHLIWYFGMKFKSLSGKLQFGSYLSTATSTFNGAHTELCILRSLIGRCSSIRSKLHAFCKRFLCDIDASWALRTIRRIVDANPVVGKLKITTNL